MNSFLEQLITAFNENGINCQIEATNFKGSTEKKLYINIDVTTDSQKGEVKLDLEKFSKTFGKMLLMNGKGLNECVKEYIIILKKLIESGMVKLMNPINIDKSKLIE